MHPRVKTYIAKQKSPQKEIIQKLRRILYKTLPKIEENFKNGVPWYEDKYYFVGLKDHINMGFSVNGLSGKERDLFEGKGKLMRHVKFYSSEEIIESKITRLIKLVAKRHVPCH